MPQVTFLRKRRASFVHGFALFFATVALSLFLVQTTEAAACPASDGGAGDGDASVNGILTINSNTTWLPSDNTAWDCSGLDLLITNNSTLTFSSNTTSGYYGYLLIDNLQVDFGATLSSNSKGCTLAGGANSNGFGPNGSNVCTISTAGYGASPGGGAGGHGGAGGSGTGATASAGGTMYGSSTAPVLFGSSSGASTFAAAGAGGGVIRLEVTGTLTLNGTISANGGNGNTFSTNIATGGGAGGSVYITTGIVSGSTGSITATGGNGANTASADGGGGGGGRIALIYESSTFSGMGSEDFSVAGGDGADTAVDGTKGTVYVKDTTTNAVTVYHGFRYAADYSASTWTVDSSATNQTCDTVDTTPSIATTGALSLSGTWTCSNASIAGMDWSPGGAVTLSGLTFSMAAGDILTINDAVAVTVTGNSTINANLQWTNLSSLTVDAGSTLSANSKGCTLAGGSNSNGFGPNGSNVCTISTAGYGASPGGGAGGHGGAGGNGTGVTASAGGTTYGSSTAPVLFGSSSGASTFAAAGAGGGVIRLDVTGTLAFNGTISANGGNGNTYSTNIATGGGAGGSVYITTGAVSGSTGSITATGGNGANTASADGGGGGGGRIAISYGQDTFVGGLSSFLEATIVAGGLGPDTAVDGSVGTFSLDQTLFLSSITITDNSGYTNDTTPVITITESGVTPTHVAFSCNGGANWSAWLPFPDDDVVNDNDGPAFDITLDATGCSATNELKTISAKIKDASDETAAVSDSTTLDTVAPIVSTVSATNADGTYDAGTVITTTVQFNENMSVTGTPQIQLDMDVTDRQASYSGTSTTTLSFTYTIAVGDLKTDLDYTGTGALTLNGGTITDIAGNTATLTLASPGASNSLGANKAINISTVALTSISITDNSGYTNDATPVIYMVSAGATPTHIAYSCNGGSNWSDWLVLADDHVINDDDGPYFNYTTDATGCSVTNELKTISAKIKNAAGETPAVSDTTTFDNTAPTVGNVTSTNADDTYGATEVITVTVQFTETSMQVTGTPQIQLDMDGTDRQANYASVLTDTLSFTYTIATGDNKTDLDYTGTGALTLNGGTITDLAGNTATLTLASPGAAGSLGANKALNIVTNQAPTVASVTAELATDSSGDVTVTFIMDDPDNDDTLQAKVEYSLNGGSSWADPTLSTVGSETFATFGDPGIDNSVNYQVGQGTYITSSSGANTVTIVWEAATDISASTDISNARIRLTPYDGTTEGGTGTSANFIIDLVSPTNLAGLTDTGFSSSQITLTWIAAVDSNFNHYEIWYSRTEADVASRSGSAEEWDNDNDASLATVGTTTTTLVSDPRNRYFQIYAVDDFGNLTTTDSHFRSYTSGPPPPPPGPVPISDGDDDDDDEDEDEDEEEENSEEEPVADPLPESPIEEHWAEGYLEYLDSQDVVVEMASEIPTFMDILVNLILHPDTGMNRGEATEFLLVLADYPVTTASVDTTPSFTDVEAHPRQFFIELAAELGLVDGYTDGSFQPDLVINRAEVLKLVSHFFGVELDTALRGDALLESYGLTENPLTDVDLEAWFAPYVLHAYANGVVNGYGDGTFGPGNGVTGAEFLKIAILYQNVESAVQLAEELSVQ